MLIDGALLRGAGDPFDVVDPATGAVHTTLTAASADQVDAGIAAAAAAFPGWRDRPQGDRSGALRGLAAGIEARRDDLVRALTIETGRPASRNGLYVDMARDLFAQYAELARVFGGRVAPANEARQLDLVLRVPYGVVAALVPWNYPLLLLTFKVAPALAAGNTVVIKPASETPLTTLLLGELFAEHLPAGVANVVVGGGSTVGQAIVDHPGVDLVAFTGSTEVGTAIGAACAARAVPTHLEMGGKDAAIVFADADLGRAAEGTVWSAFLNAGQVCTSTERVYVHRSLIDDYLERVVALAGAIAVGDPFDEATQVGPLRSERARSAVLGQVAAATEAGATVLAGGHALDRPGFFMAPTVVADVDHTMGLVRDETFGPVLPVMAFDDVEEAIALANDTPYGLGGSVYTSDPVVAERCWRELRTGMLHVNDPLVDNVAAPFGGVGASGDARELGWEAMASFTVPKHVHWALAPERKPWWYVPDAG
ncbi:MAG: aldehyde dehydrogenase family protein [Acidimicrobiia bacterium]